MRVFSHPFRLTANGSLATVEQNSTQAIAEQIAPKIPGCTVVQWPDRGHFGPLEDPDRFVELIREVEAQLS